jgi:acyl-CoA synthetase (AMP-forming)/AMP-acid ligase II
MRAAEQDCLTAFEYLVSANEVSPLTYGELDQRARAIAALLQEHNAEGERVLLLYPPGLDFIAGFFGCLYAGAVAVPTFPPRFNSNLIRLKSIVSDAAVTIALTTDNIFSGLKSLLDREPELSVVRWLLSSDSIGLEDEWREFVATDETLALLQYTSGSTSEPKGVMLTHGNLLHNSARICEAFGCSVEGVGVSWLPPYHDMGLIGGVLQPIFVGGTTILMSPLTFLQRPIRWLEAISRYSLGREFVVSGGPNFAYDMCVDRVTPEQRRRLNLSKWKVAFTGAEPIRPETLSRFAESFSSSGFEYSAFYPCYGLAECTLMVSGGLRHEPPITLSVQRSKLEQHSPVNVTPNGHTYKLTSCGRNMADQDLRIVDPETLLECAEGEVGEIWVASRSVATGYWKRPEETEKCFAARIAGTNDGPFLRTGDLGFLLLGELCVTGRLKDLIIIDGRNHYPQDLERTVEQSHSALRENCCAAFSVSVDGQEQLFISAELDVPASDQLNPAVAKAIQIALAEAHDLKAYKINLLRKGDLPKTSSGKLQRHRCRAEFTAALQVSTL